jgi:RNA polymerase sigma factor (sigma-70 family)
MRFLIARQLGNENLEDIVHNAFIDVLQAIRQGRVEDPERLLGFIRVVVQRKVAAEIQRRVQARKSVDIEDRTAVDPTPSMESDHARTEEIRVARDVLNGMNPRRRDVLERFYLKEQSPQQICEEMGLTDDQFRNLKNRGKAAFSAKVERLLKTPASAEPGRGVTSGRPPKISVKSEGRFGCAPMAIVQSTEHERRARAS